MKRIVSLGVLAATLSAAIVAPAPAQSPDSTQVRRVSGRVALGTRKGPRGVANSWVVLHRVGPDQSGPLDSTRTSDNGSFGFRYRTSGSADAIYFVSTAYGGIAYFSSALRQPVVSGDDAMITVFDTTSGPVAIKTAGRHLIIGAPGPNRRRPVGEVFELENDTTVTLIGSESNPSWGTHLPGGATAFEVNPNGDVAPTAIAQRDSRVDVYVPLSPGVRQVAFTYQLPREGFPLVVPLERTTGLLEVLVEEPSARVSGTGLTEVAPVNTDGRTFRRFLAQDLPANTVIRVEIPEVIGNGRLKFYAAFGGVIVLAMAVGLIVASRRNTPRRAAKQSGGIRRSSNILGDIAVLDAEFEQRESSTEAEEASYRSRRAELKEELADALAGEQRTA